MSRRRKTSTFNSFEEVPQLEIPIKSFHINFKNAAQKLAWSVYQGHDIVFLLGVAGSGKTHMAMAFAIYDIIDKNKGNIILTRPVLEAGESMGYLPGTIEEKINPYMLPLYDVLYNICGTRGHNREIVEKCIEVAPLGFMRGRTFQNSVCILDEAQNCTRSQIKLFLTRMGTNSKMVITGDPKQSDLSSSPDLIDVVSRLESVKGVGIVYFDEDCIVRHPLVGEVVRRLEK